MEFNEEVGREYIENLELFSLKFWVRFSIREGETCILSPENRIHENPQVHKRMDQQGG